jgi:hypothetical protein
LQNKSPNCEEMVKEATTKMDIPEYLKSEGFDVCACLDVSTSKHEEVEFSNVEVVCCRLRSRGGKVDSSYSTRKALARSNGTTKRIH